MRDDSKHLSGKHRQSDPLPISNPELPSKKDWWDELCKAHGEENFWKKKSSKKGGK